VLAIQAVGALLAFAMALRRDRPRPAAGEPPKARVHDESKDKPGTYLEPIETA